jgi:hypothetical protein
MRGEEPGVKIIGFEALNAWQKARELTNAADGTEALAVKPSPAATPFTLRL